MKRKILIFSFLFLFIYMTNMINIYALDVKNDVDLEEISENNKSVEITKSLIFVKNFINNNTFDSIVDTFVDGNIKELEENSKELTIDFIDVGQGDCTLISYDGDYLLIDGGSNDNENLLKCFMQNKGIEKFDYVIATHDDLDHLGGLDILINEIPTKNIIMSSYIEDLNIYNDLTRAIYNNNVNVLNPKFGDKYYLGDGEAYFEIITQTEDYDEIYDGENYEFFRACNSLSIGIIFHYKDFSAIFLGDSNEDVELELMESGINLDIDVYKVSNHGSNAASGEDFLKEMSPDVAIISCGKENAYGHPRGEILGRFKILDIPFYRTDEQGTIRLTTRGYSYSFDKEPSLNYKGNDKSIHKDMPNYFLNN